MFNKKQKKDKKKSTLNLDSIQDNIQTCPNTPLENQDHQGEGDNESNLGKRNEPFILPAKKAQNAALQGQSDHLNKIYQSTIQNTEMLLQPTSQAQIQDQLKKLKDETLNHYKSLDDQKRESVKVFAKEHINSITGKVDNVPIIKESNLEPGKIKKSQISQVSSKFGPVRQMRTIQHSNGIDRNPMRCKDYFESGYCAFGMSCIFIHDRSDYKSGQELDSEWDAKNKHKVERRKIRVTKELAGEDLDSDDMSTESEGLEDYQDELVYKEIDEQCLICGLDYKMPSLLPCGHIFCDKCAVQQYKLTNKCFKCSKVSGGIFNDGTKLLKKAREERERLKNRVKVKKNRYGLPSGYLQGLSTGQGDKAGRNYGFTEDDDDTAVVVSKETIEAAMRRISDY